MPFPASDRVIYEKNPLVGVTFHARFSRMLEVDSELPTAFQKSILSEYPLLEEREVIRLTMSTSGADTSPASERGKVYDFLSADKVWKASLASDSLSLTATKYTTWEDFLVRLKSLVNQFLSVYEVPFFTRIGLRYQNVIARDLLGLEGRLWNELLNPHFAGEFTDTAFPESDYQVRQSFFRLKLDQDDFVQVTHGLIHQVQTKGIAYRLDGDFYNEKHGKAEVDGIVETASRLNANSGKLFRWAIKPLLHEAMGPRPG